MESYPIGPGKRFVRYKFSEGGPLIASLVALISFGFFAYGVNHFVWQQRFAVTALPAHGVITRVEIGDNDGTLHARERAQPGDVSVAHVYKHFLRGGADGHSLVPAGQCVRRRVGIERAVALVRLWFHRHRCHLQSIVRQCRAEHGSWLRNVGHR